MRRLLLLALLLARVAGCGKVTEVREPDVVAGSGITPAPRPTSARRAARPRAHRGRHPRPGLEHVLDDRPQRRRRRERDRPTCRSPTSRPTSTTSGRCATLIDEAVAAQARRARRLDPRPGDRRRRSGAPCGPASRWSRSTRAATSSRRSGCSPTSASPRSAAGCEAGERHGGGRRAATRCASTRRSATSASTSAAPAFARGDARGRRHAARARRRRPRTSPRRAAGSPGVDRSPASTPCWRSTTPAAEVAADGPCRRDVLIGTFDFTPDGAARRSGAGRIAVRRRPAALPAGLHADRVPRGAGALRAVPGAGRGGRRPGRTSSPRPTPRRPSA